MDVDMPHRLDEVRIRTIRHERWTNEDTVPFAPRSPQLGLGIPKMASQSLPMGSSDHIREERVGDRLELRSNSHLPLMRQVFSSRLRVNMKRPDPRPQAETTGLFMLTRKQEENACRNSGRCELLRN